MNQAAGRLPQWKAEGIIRAADDAISGRLDEDFPRDERSQSVNAGDLLLGRENRACPAIIYSLRRDAGGIADHVLNAATIDVDAQLH